MPSQSWSRSGDALDPQDCEDGPGHEWSPAGGGLLICISCESEKWAQDDGPGGEFEEDYEVPGV